MWRYNATMRRLVKLLTQFSIRDLLWLMVVAAAMACWYREHGARLKHNKWLENKEAELAKRESAIKNAKWRAFQFQFSNSGAVTAWPDEASPGIYFLK